MIMIQCCKDCPDRNIGCHSTCEQYLAQKAEHDLDAERIRNIKIQDYEFKKLAGDHRYKRVKRKRGKT